MTLDELKRLKAQLDAALAGDDADKFTGCYWPAADAALDTLPDLIEAVECLRDMHDESADMELTTTAARAKDILSRLGVE